MIATLTAPYAQGQQQYFEGGQTIYFRSVTYEPNENEYPYYYNGTSDPTGRWEINGTAAEIVYQTPEVAYVRTKGLGPFYLSHWNDTDQTKELFITVYPAPPAPNRPVIHSEQCGQVTIRMNGQPPADVIWYWQIIPNGQSTSYGTSENWPAPGNGTYYLQSRSTLSGDVWGETSPPLVVTIPQPPVDGTIYSDKTKICLGQSFTIFSTGGTGIPHYWGSSNGGSTWNLFSDAHVGEASFPVTPSVPGTYRFHLRNETPFCGKCTDPGNTCTSFPYVDVVVEDHPATGELFVNNANVNTCVGTVPINVVGSPGTPHFWISKDGVSVEDATTFQLPYDYPVNEPGQWKFEMKSYTECGFSETATSFTITVWPLPGEPQIFNIVPVCAGGSAILHALPSPNAYGVHWYESASGGSPMTPFPGSSDVPTGPLTSSRQYWVSSYLSFGCEGLRMPVSVTVDPLPIDSDIAADVTTVCVGQPVHITTSGGTGTTHFWASSNGGLTWNIFKNAYVGQTDFYHTPNLAGTYRYMVHNYTNCSSCGEEGNSCAPVEYVDVIVEGLPTPGEIFGPTGVVFGKSHSFSLPNAAHGTSFTWTVTGGGEILTGQGTPNITARFFSNGAQLSVTATNSTCGTSLPSSLTVREGLNYIIEENVLMPGFHDPSSLQGISEEEKRKSTTYFDGLGRPVQAVHWKASPAGSDIVQPIIYDRYGREARTYLPFVMGDNGSYKPEDELIDADKNYIGTPKDFYAVGSNNAVADDAKPYANTVFEASPLNRILEKGAAGTPWQPDAVNSYDSEDRTIKFSYETNAENEVIRWNYVPGTANTPISITHTGNFYERRQLYKTRTKDEDRHEVVEYKDKSGRIILRRVQASSTEWADTYYIYDNFGNLVAVLPPEAVRALD